METTFTPETQTEVISPKSLLAHWQGHRRLTRKLIEAFPEKELFTYSVGGMRPFAEIVKELLSMAAPIVHGTATGDWVSAPPIVANTKEEILRLWDIETEKLNAYWTQISPGRFQSVELAFGQWEGANIDTIFYGIDNEIHHRGQGYVYLRSLGVTPPLFWERD